MPWFEGTHTEKRTIDAPLDTVRAHFANTDAIIAQTKHVESSAVDAGVIHFVMEEEDYQVTKFKADFRCKYTLDGDTLSWETLEGNLKQSGEATFAADGDRTVMDYNETVAVDVNVPSMMAPMLKPVVGAMLAGEIKGYVERMASSV